jgi:hypothetical protein
MIEKTGGGGVFGNPSMVEGKQDITGSIMSNAPGSGEATNFSGGSVEMGLNHKESIDGMSMESLGMETSGAGQVPQHQPRDSADRGTRFG